jgi:hypothetical protein
MFGCAALACIGLPMSAQAHLVTTGLGPFYDGITHFVVSFEDSLPALAIALLAGMQGPRAARLALLALPVGWLVGGLFAKLWPISTASAALMALALVILGAAIALDRRLTDRLIGAASLGFGLGAGYLSSGPIEMQTGLNGLGLLGTALTAFVVVALAAALAVAARSHAARTVIRVAGSWLAAIGLLRVGWWIAGAG